MDQAQALAPVFMRDCVCAPSFVLVTRIPLQPDQRVCVYKQFFFVSAH